MLCAKLARARHWIICFHRPGPQGHLAALVSLSHPAGVRSDEVLFLNYAFEEAPPMNIPLPPGRANRACDPTLSPRRGKRRLAVKVLEVSCAWVRCHILALAPGQP